MNLAELSEVAKKYYLRVKEPSTVIGWEKYVLTDGTNCVFVKSDYVPKQGETMFFLVMRNRNVMIQLYKEYTPSPVERYSLQPRQNLWWEVRDNITGVSCEFLEGMYFEDRKPSVPAEQTENLSTIVRDMGKWLYDNHHHISICNKDARKAIIERVSRRKNWWETLAAAFNGFLFEEDENIDIRVILRAQVSDFLKEQNPFAIDDVDELVDLFWIPDEDCTEFYPTTAEIKELVAIIRAFWDSDRDINVWSRDLALWPTLVK